MSVNSDSLDECIEVEVEVSEWNHPVTGVLYFKDDSGIIYDRHTYEELGFYIESSAEQEEEESSEYEEEITEVYKWNHPVTGVLYYIDDSGIIYDSHAHERVGHLNTLSNIFEEESEK